MSRTAALETSDGQWLTYAVASHACCARALIDVRPPRRRAHRLSTLWIVNMMCTEFEQMRISAMSKTKYLNVWNLLDWTFIVCQLLINLLFWLEREAVGSVLFMPLPTITLPTILQALIAPLFAGLSPGPSVDLPPSSPCCAPAAGLRLPRDVDARPLLLSGVRAPGHLRAHGSAHRPRPGAHRRLEPVAAPHLLRLHVPAAAARAALPHRGLRPQLPARSRCACGGSSPLSVRVFRRLSSLSLTPRAIRSRRGAAGATLTTLNKALRLPTLKSWVPWQSNQRAGMDHSVWPQASRRRPVSHAAPRSQKPRARHLARDAGRPSRGQRAAAPAANVLRLSQTSP